MNLSYMEYVNLIYTFHTQRDLQAPNYNSGHKRSILLADKLMGALQRMLNSKERSGNVATTGSGQPMVSLCSFK